MRFLPFTFSFFFSSKKDSNRDFYLKNNIKQRISRQILIEIKKAKKLQVLSHNRAIMVGEERNFCNVWKKISDRDICNKKIFLEFSISRIITFCVICFVSIYDCVKDKNWIDKMTEIVLKKDVILPHWNNSGFKNYSIFVF